MGMDEPARSRMRLGDEIHDKERIAVGAPAADFAWFAKRSRSEVLIHRPYESFRYGIDSKGESPVLDGGAGSSVEQAKSWNAEHGGAIDHFAARLGHW